MKEILTDWRFWTFIIAVFSLLFSAFNLIVGKIVAHKLQNNEIKHLKEGIKGLKDSEKEFKIDLKNELQKIFRRLGKIEKIQYAQQKVCNERHKLDK